MLEVNSDANLLVVLRSFPQGYPCLLWKLSWLCSTPADALALGVVNVSEIIQRSSLPNLQHAQQIFTDGNQSDRRCNYILKIHRHQTLVLACRLQNYSRCWYTESMQSSRVLVLWLHSTLHGTVVTNVDLFILIKVYEHFSHRLKCLLTKQWKII